MKATIGLLVLASLALGLTPTNWQLYRLEQPTAVSYFGKLTANPIDTPGERLAATGAVMLWTTTLTSLAVLPWMSEEQRERWYWPVALVALAGAGLWVTGAVVQ